MSAAYLASRYGAPAAPAAKKKTKKRRKKKQLPPKANIRVHDDEDDAWNAPTAGAVQENWDNWTTKEEAPAVVTGVVATEAAALPLTTARQPRARARHDTPSPVAAGGSRVRQRHDSPSPPPAAAPRAAAGRRQRHDSSSDDSASSSSSSSSSDDDDDDDFGGDAEGGAGRRPAKRRRRRHDSPPPSPRGASDSVPAAAASSSSSGAAASVPSPAAAAAATTTTTAAAAAAAAQPGAAPLKQRPSMSSGRSAGLQSGDQFAREGSAARSKAKAALRAQGPSSSQSATVYRDAAGKKLEVTEALLKTERARQGILSTSEKAEAEYDWGVGAAQKVQMAEAAATLRAAADAPFTRYDGDREVENLLKEKLHAGDPMAQYIEAQRLKREKKEERRRRKALKRSGGEASAAAAAAPPPRRSKPKYSGPARLPHRFGAVPLPGYRWDGVDRANGFESRVLAVKNREGQVSLREYRYRSSDM